LKAYKVTSSLLSNSSCTVIKNIPEQGVWSAGEQKNSSKQLYGPAEWTVWILYGYMDCTALLHGLYGYRTDSVQPHGLYGCPVQVAIFS
jgi:hypothetical protein